MSVFATKEWYANSNNSQAYDEKEMRTLFLCFSISTLFYETFSHLNFRGFFSVKIFIHVCYTSRIHTHLLHHTTVSNAMCGCFSLSRSPSLCVFAWLHSTIFYEFIQFIIFPFALIVYSLHGYTHSRLLLWIYTVVFIYSSLPISLSISWAIQNSHAKLQKKTHSS